MRKDVSSLAVALIGITGAVGLVVVSALSTGESIAQEKVKDGRPIFKEHECAGCHSIQAVKIELDIGNLDPEEVDEDAPDLSAVGKKHEIAWMKQYLLKKVEQNGEKHEKKFRGTDEELDTLTKWLFSMKTDVKVVKKK